MNTRNARYIDSIEGRIERLKEAFRTLVTTTITTDMFKDFVSGATDVVNGINGIISACDDLGIATPVVFGSLAGVFSMIKQKATQAERATQNVTNQTGNVTKFSEAFRNTFSGSIASKFLNGLKAIPNKFKEIKTNVQNTTGAVNKCKVAFQSLGGGAVLGRLGSLVGTIAATAGNMALMMGVSIVVSKIFQSLSDEIHKVDNELEKHTNNIENYKSEIKQLSETKASIQSIADEYDELAKKTEKTAEEQERFNELRRELADTLGEDYVLAYDENGNPILKMTDDVQDLIDELDIAIQRKNALLAAEKREKARDAVDWLNENDSLFGSKNSELDRQAMQEASASINKYRQALSKAVTNFTVASQSGDVDRYNEQIERLKQSLNNYSSSIEEGYSKVVQEYNKVQEKVQAIRDGIVADLTSDRDFQNLSEGVKNFGYNLSQSLDFSHVSDADITAYTNSLKKALSDDQIDSALVKYQKLRKELEKTGQYESYEKNVSKLVPELSKLWGVTEDVAKSMVKTPSIYRQAQSALDAYLMTFGKREQMGSFDKETADLIARYDSFTNILTTLGSIQGYEVDGEVQFNIAAVAALKNAKDMPKEVNSLIDNILSDGKVTQEEHTLLTKLSIAYTTANKEDQEKYLKEAVEMLKKMFPNAKIDLGDIKVDSNFELDDNTKKKIEDKFEELKSVFGDDEDLIKTIKANVTNPEQVQLFADIIKNLDATPEDIEKFIKANVENLAQMESYEGIVEFLLNNPEIANKFKIQVVGDDTVKAVEDSIDGLMKTKQEKKIAVKMINSLKEGDLDEFNRQLASLPEEKRVNVVAAITDALGKIDAVDAKTIKDKVIEFKESGFKVTIEKEKKVDEGAKNKTKTIRIKNPDGLSTLKQLQDINDNAQDKTVTITTILKTVRKSIVEKGLMGFAIGADNSVSEFNNISSDPMQAEALSTQSAQPVASPSSTPVTLSNNNSLATTQATNSFGDIGSLFTKDTKINITNTTVNKAIEYSIKLFQELQNQISKVNNKLDLLNTKSERAIGTNKIEYLRQQNALYEEQQRLQKKLYENSNQEREHLQAALKGYGFNFDDQGNLTEYEETLLAMEDNAKRLNEEAERVSKSTTDSSKQAVKSITYNMEGLSEAQKNTFKKLSDEDKKTIFGANRVIESISYKTSKSTKNNTTASDIAKEYSEKLEMAKKLANEYLQLQYTEIPNAEKEWYALANSIKKNNDEIEKLTRENNLYKFVNKISQLNNELEISSNKLDIIEAKLSNAYGSNEITLTKQKLELLNEQLEKQQEIMNQLNNQMSIYQKDLARYGAVFDSDGNISNLESILNTYQNSEDRDKVQDLIDEYIDKITNELPSVQKEYEELKNDIISVHKDTLDKTKDIEEKITDMIQDELDKRKKAIKDQTDKELELIDKRKKAYQDSREEENYQKELKEQQDKISDIKKQIELAKKDNSLSGRAKLEELLKELEEENKTLNEKIQDRTDKMVEEMYDNESDKLQEKSDKMIEDLENAYTDKKIAEIVQQSLLSGLYTDIDGNIKTLQDSLINFAEESGDALGITGDLIKNELVGNMESACNYAKNYKDIMDSLALKSYGNLDYVKGIQNVGDIKNVTIGDTVININGNTDNTTVDSIKKEIDSYMQDIINKI